MERNRYLNDQINAANDDRADEAIAEKDVRTLTDLELVLAGGGDGPICW